MTRDSPHTLLYILIAAMVVFWSANHSIGKIMLREFPPLLAGGLRISLAAVFLAPLYLLQRDGPSWSKQDLPALLFLGLAGIALNQAFFMIGLSRTSASHSVLIMGLTPIFVLLVAAAGKQEHITPRKAAGMLTALAGVAILNLQPATVGAPGSGPTALGDFFLALGALTFALFTVLGKKLSLRHSSIAINTFAYTSGSLALAPLTIWQAWNFPFAHVSLGAWTSLLYMAMFPSVICYLIYCYALSHIPASRVAAFAYLQPVLATTIAVLVLGERVTAPLVAGGAVIFSGVYLTERG